MDQQRRHLGAVQSAPRSGPALGVWCRQTNASDACAYLSLDRACRAQWPNGQQIAREYVLSSTPLLFLECCFSFLECRLSTFRARAKVSQNLHVSVQFVRHDHAARVPTPKMLDHRDDLKCLDFANAAWTAISLTGLGE